MQTLQKRFEYKGHTVEITTTRAAGNWRWRFEIDGQLVFAEQLQPGHRLEAAAVTEAAAEARCRIDKLT